MPEYTLNINIDGGSVGKKSKAEQSLSTVLNKNNKEALGSSGGSVSNADKAKLSTVAKVGSVTALAVVHSATEVAKYKLSHYGSKYSYQARQNQINNAFSTIGDVSKLGATIGASALVAGPIGAVVGLVSGVFDLSYQMYERNQEWVRKNHEYELEQTRLSERLGLLSSDRNRGR